MRCKPGQDFLPYDRPIAVSKIGSTSVLDIDSWQNLTSPRIIEASATSAAERGLRKVPPVQSKSPSISAPMKCDSLLFIYRAI